ncbi:MAG: hypothetical protein B7Y02_00655 [Rhodobacterales bacterium 17-64-5]|nr:MAG: hypothetical protein B7Y02_00655 [Rhodobacterales bacterium 17-64-5]
MKKIVIVSASLAVFLAVPFAAQAAKRLTPEELLKSKQVIEFCGDRTVVSAKYLDDTSNRVGVECKDAKGFFPLLGGLLAGGGGAAAAALTLVVVAGANGGGGSTPDTQQN